MTQWTIEKERVVSRGKFRDMWRLEKDGRLVAHYRTKRDAELHGPKLDLALVPWRGDPIRSTHRSAANRGTGQ